MTRCFSRAAASRTRQAALCSAVCGVLGCALSAEAGSSFSAASTATIKHYADAGSAIPVQTKNVNPPPASGSMSVPPSYQYSKSIAVGSGQSSASGSLGAFTTSTTSGFTLAAGTSLVQSDPTGSNFISYSSLKFVIDGTWTATSPSFGPTTTGYVSFNLTGSVANDPGAYAQYIVNLRFTDATKTTDYRTPISSSGSFGPGAAINVPFSNSAMLLSGSLATGNSVRVSGTIEFRSHDPGGPVAIGFHDFETSGAPPTSTLVSSGSSVAWFEPANWSTDFLADAVPNGTGVRARLVGNGAPQQIMLGSSVTLGTLDIDDAGSVTISNAGVPAGLTMDVTAGKAQILVRNVQGNGSHSITVPMNLMDDLEIRNDSAGALVLGGAVTGTGGITKEGLGTLVLTGPGANTYLGNTTINGGFIDANKPGAIPSGSVSITGGQLNYNATGAVASTVLVSTNGELNLGVTPTAADHFSVADLGCIRGSSIELAGLSVGSNLILSSGAMIGHETFDTGASGNPVGLGTLSNYVYGISADLGGGSASFVFGSASGTPWKGFGSDRGIHSFGVGSTDSHSITVAGTAELDSLSGELALNSRLLSSGAGSLTKRGGGLVSINNVSNSFSGTITVADGALAVNGALGSGASVTVNAGATLGGAGTIGGAVSFASAAAAHLAPGRIAPIAFAPPPFAAATTVGTLHTGSLTLSGSTQLDYELNTPTSLGGTDSDLVMISGSLTLDGGLHIIDGPNFGVGTYTLMTYSGGLTDNGLVVLPDAPSGYAYQIFAAGGSVVLSVVVPKWNVDASADWTTASSWIGPVPNAPDAIANFTDVITAPATITLTSPQTAGALTFRNANKYTIAGSTLTLDTSSGADASINVDFGSHAISAPIVLAKNTTISVVQPASRLMISGDLTAAAGVTLSKEGPGALEAKNYRVDQLMITEGLAKVTNNGSFSGTSRVRSLVISNSGGAWLGRLDLSNNHMVIDYSGSSPLAVVGDQITSGYNGGSWNGTGIGSSAAPGGFNGHVTALGYAEASAVLSYSGGTASFSGQTLTDTSAVLIRYTLAGDANLSGGVDLTDFTFLAANFNKPGGAQWLEGDFNYDHKVDLTDFTFLAANFNQSMPAEGLGSVIPEPAATGLLAAMLLSIVPRGRRHRRRKTG